MGFIGVQDVQAGGIGFGVNGNAVDLQVAQGTQDAAGNGATVGNQDFFEHGITPEGDAGRPAVFDERRGRPRRKNLFSSTLTPVGASMLAMDVNDYA